MQKEAATAGVALNKMVSSLSGDQAIKDLQKLRDTTHDTSSAFDSGLGSITKWAAGLVTVTAAIDLVKVGFEAVVGFLSDSVTAAAAAEASQAQLAATMASHGVAVPDVIDAYQGYISVLAATTTQSDDALTASAALLTTMGVMPKEMNAALTAATNLAERFGGGEQGLAKATEAVGKAAMGQTTSLAKAGITLDDTKVKAEGFQYVVTEVNDQLGGAAVAAANTYAGRLAQLGNAWDELQESVGMAIVQNQTVIDTIDAVADAFTGANGSLAANRDVMNFVSDTVILLVQAFALLTRAIGAMAGPIKSTIQEFAFFPKVAAMFVRDLLAMERGLNAIGMGTAGAEAKLSALAASLEGTADSFNDAAQTVDDFQDGAAALAREADKLTQHLKTTRGETVAAHPGDEPARQRDQSLDGESSRATKPRSKRRRRRTKKRRRRRRRRWTPSPRRCASSRAARRAPCPKSASSRPSS